MHGPFKTLNRIAVALATATCLTAMAGCNWLRGYADGRSHRIPDYESRTLSAAQIGAARFVFDDVHGLSTDTLESTAVPWKLASTALVLHRHPGESPTPERLRAILSGFGFLYPERIGNWPLDDQPRFDHGLLGGIGCLHLADENGRHGNG